MKYDEEPKVFFDFRKGTTNVFGHVREMTDFKIAYYTRVYQTGTLGNRIFIDGEPSKIIDKNGNLAPMDALAVDHVPWTTYLEREIHVLGYCFRKIRRPITQTCEIDFDEPDHWFEQEFEVGPNIAYRQEQIIPFIQVTYAKTSLKAVPLDWITDDFKWISSQELYLAREFLERERDLF